MDAARPDAGAGQDGGNQSRGMGGQPRSGLTVVFISSEMGEVVRGSIHYRALFMVGLVLFFLSLLINWLAQKIVRRYRISIG